MAEMTTRKVLTVNQVLEILLEWVATKDWREALYSVVPKRKFQSNEVGNREVVYEDNVEDFAAGEEDTRPDDRTVES